MKIILIVKVGKKILDVQNWGIGERNYISLIQIQLCGGGWVKLAKYTGLNILWSFYVYNSKILAHA